MLRVGVCPLGPVRIAVVGSSRSRSRASTSLGCFVPNVHSGVRSGFTCSTNIGLLCFAAFACPCLLRAKSLAETILSGPFIMKGF